MKINELVGEFHIYMNNEEKALFDQLDTPASYESFTEREQLVLDNMIHKSIVKRYNDRSVAMVKKNEQL